MGMRESCEMGKHVWRVDGNSASCENCEAQMEQHPDAFYFWGGNFNGSEIEAFRTREVRTWEDRPINFGAPS